MLRFAYNWLFYVPLLLLSSAVLAVVCVVVALFSQRIASRVIAKAWARLNFISAGATIEVRGLEHIQPRQTYVVVANHYSQFDILALYGWLPLDLKWVMKKELRRVPFIGFSCAAMGHVFIDRANKQAAKASLQALKSSLPADVSVLFFPEGTRGNGQALLPFKRGAFTTAKVLNKAILPISIKGTEKVLPNGTVALKSGHVEIVIHPEISREAVAETDEAQLLAMAQAKIQEVL